VGSVRVNQVAGTSSAAWPGHFTHIVILGVSFAFVKCTMIGVGAAARLTADPQVVVVLGAVIDASSVAGLFRYTAAVSAPVNPKVYVFAAGGVRYPVHRTRMFWEDTVELGSSLSQLNSIFVSTRCIRTGFDEGNVKTGAPPPGGMALV
jgi:hypothetical protein